MFEGLTRCCFVDRDKQQKNHQSYGTSAVSGDLHERTGGTYQHAAVIPAHVMSMKPTGADVLEGFVTSINVHGFPLVGLV